VILNTVDYKQKIISLLEDTSYRRLTRDPTDSTERKTTLLLKKPTLTEDICKQLRPAGSRSPRLYGLPKIHKEGVPLRPTVSYIGAPTYQLSKYIAGLLGQLIYQAILRTYVPLVMEQSVPKRRHIKFRRRRITQKKAYNIQNKAEV
jgi:hypothetical protein